MKRVAVFVSLLLVAVPAIALAKSNGDKPKAGKEKQAKRAEKAKATCEAVLQVVGEENFNELYGKGDQRADATINCQKAKSKSGKKGKKNGKRGGPGQIRRCMKESGVTRNSSKDERKAAKEKCKSELKGKKKGKKEGKKGKHLDVLKACTDEKATNAVSFNEKYTALGKANSAAAKKKLEEKKAKLEARGKSTKKIDKKLAQIDKGEPRPFRVCVKTKLRKLKGQAKARKGKAKSKEKGAKRGSRERRAGQSQKA